MKNILDIRKVINKIPTLVPSSWILVLLMSTVCAVFSDLAKYPTLFLAFSSNSSIAFLWFLWHACCCFYLCFLILVFQYALSQREWRLSSSLRDIFCFMFNMKSFLQGLLYLFFSLVFPYGVFYMASNQFSEYLTPFYVVFVFILLALSFLYAILNSITQTDFKKISNIIFRDKVVVCNVLLIASCLAVLFTFIVVILSWLQVILTSMFLFDFLRIFVLFLFSSIFLLSSCGELAKSIIKKNGLPMKAVFNRMDSSFPVIYAEQKNDAISLLTSVLVSTVLLLLPALILAIVFYVV